MKLKEEYQNLDLKKLLVDNLENGVKGQKLSQELMKEHIEKINQSMELIKMNNWEQTYIALYFIIDEMSKENISLKAKSKPDGVIGAIQDVSVILFFALTINDTGKFKQFNFGCNIADEYNNINNDTILLEVDSKDKEKLARILDDICEEWKDTFIIVDEKTKKAETSYIKIE